MKNFVLAGLFCLGLVACVSSGSVDPGSNVSVGDMRTGLVKAQDNVWGNVYPAIAALASEDLADANPKHNAKWWKAKLAVLSTTATMISDTLAGAKK